MDKAVEITDLKKSFDGYTFVLKGMSLDIPKHKITAIIGFSGTGKSVLFKHILGIHKPTSGEIKVLGNDLSDLTEMELANFRTKLGVLFQHAALFDDMTAIENAEFPLKEHRRDLSEARVREIATKKLIMSGIEEEHFNKLPSELSGGMQKRVGLARALALDPEIIFYDEPTTGLDPILTEMVDNLIFDTHKNLSGTTSVMISHDLTAAFRLADHVIMLNKGEVVLTGAPQVFLDTKIEFVKKFVDKGLRRESAP